MPHSEKKATEAETGSATGLIEQSHTSAHIFLWRAWSVFCENDNFHRHPHQTWLGSSYYRTAEVIKWGSWRYSRSKLQTCLRGILAHFHPQHLQMLSEVLNNAPVQVQDKNKRSSSHLFPLYQFVRPIYSTQFSISLLKQSQSTITNSCNLNVPPTLKQPLFLSSRWCFPAAVALRCSSNRMGTEMGSNKRIKHEWNKTQRHKQMSRYMKSLIFQVCRHQ